MQYPGILVSVKDVWSPLVNNVCSHVRLSVLLTWQRNDLVRCYCVCTQPKLGRLLSRLYPDHGEHRVIFAVTIFNLSAFRAQNHSERRTTLRALRGSSRLTLPFILLEDMGNLAWKSPKVWNPRTKT